MLYFNYVNVILKFKKLFQQCCTNAFLCGLLYFTAVRDTLYSICMKYFFFYFFYKKLQVFQNIYKFVVFYFLTTLKILKVF